MLRSGVMKSAALISLRALFLVITRCCDVTARFLASFGKIQSWGLARVGIFCQNDVVNDGISLRVEKLRTGKRGSWPFCLTLVIRHRVEQPIPAYSESLL